MSKLKHVLLQSAGWLFFLSLLMGLALLLPASTFDSESNVDTGSAMAMPIKIVR